jgi:hypothetical protein
LRLIQFILTLHAVSLAGGVLLYGVWKQLAADQSD